MAVQVLVDQTRAEERGRVIGYEQGITEGRETGYAEGYTKAKAESANGEHNNESATVTVQKPSK